MHGTSAAESVVVPLAGVPFTLAVTLTRTNAQGNALGVFEYLASDNALYESKRRSSQIEDKREA